MYLVDYHTHPFAHGNISDYNIGLYKRYIDKAVNMGIKEIGFSDHDEYDQDLDLEIIDFLKKDSPIKVLKGLEFDYIPGREGELSEKIKKYNLDYTIGSVHFIGDWGFDNPDYIKEYYKRDIDQCYIKYYEILNSAVKSGLFNIIGHFDLIKVFGFFPKNNFKNIINSVLKNIKKNDLVLEINTNGVNKPVKEIYPSLNIIERAYEYKIPITFGSDAHIVDRVGENIVKYAEVIKNIGYKEIAVFKNCNISFELL